MKRGSLKRSAVAVLLGAGCLAGCAGSRSTKAHASLSELETLARWMTGSFTSRAQAAAEPDEFKDVTLRTARIWLARGDGPWLYIEQAMSATPDKPYRQRVYRLSEGKLVGTFESAVFELPGDPLVFAGAWRRAEILDGVSPSDLSPREGCTVVLQRNHPVFSGSTVGRGCTSTLRGAAYATSEVTITPTRLISWDRGYDSGGKQVWGAEKGGYEFVKVPEGATEDWPRISPAVR